MDLRVEKLVYGGDGLTRLPEDEHGKGKSLFVPFVLEGEQVEATVTEQKPGFARASAEKIIQPSPERIAPQCPYFERCGVCHYQHSSYQHQLEIKAAILRETLRRTGKIELSCNLNIHPSPPWNYRNRSRLKVQTEPFALGYYRFRSHDFLAVEECPISSPLINRAIRQVTCSGRNQGLPVQPLELELFANQSDDAALMELYCETGTTRRDARHAAEMLAEIPELVGVAIFEQPQHQTAVPKFLASSGANHIDYKTGIACYRVSAGSFFQVNRFLIDELAETVTRQFSGESALDLYAGVGLFSVVLARSFAQVIAVESSQTSFSDLRHNAPPEVRAVHSTTERYLQSPQARPEFVVVDPPRAGLGERNARNLAGLEAPRIAYVSCDPSTLARDLRVFVDAGYKIDAADLIDLFPQTYHIESVFHLAR